MPFNEWDSFRSELNEHFLGISLYGYAREKMIRLFTAVK